MHQVQHEVFRLSSESAGMVFTGGELKTKEAGSDAGFGLRVLKGGRVGFSYCQEERGLHGALEEAANCAQFSPKTGFSFTPRPKSAPRLHFPIYDDSLDPADFPAVKGFVDEARSAAESLGGNARIILSIDRSSAELENSAGFMGSYRKSGISVYAECMHGDGFGFGYFSSFARPKEVASVGRRAAEMAKAMQGAARPPPGNYTVVFQPEALHSLMDILLPSFSGDWKRRGMTKLEKGRKHFHSQVSLCDDAAAQASAARPFDGEGTPSERFWLVKNGVVESFLYDRETAALARARGSGACARPGYDSPPAVSPSNITIAPGTWKDFGGLGPHIELHHAHGAHTANPTTGDIGLEASVAFLVDRAGKERKPLKGFMLTGNVFDMLNGIEAMESRQHVYDNIIVPRIAFSGIRVVS